MESRREHSHLQDRSSADGPNKVFGDTVVAPGAHAHLGDTIHHVKLNGEITGGVHFHLNTQPRELTAVSVVYSFTEHVYELRRFVRALNGFHDSPDRHRLRPIREMQDLLQRLERSVFELDKLSLVVQWTNDTSYIHPDLQALCVEACRNARLVLQILQPVISLLNSPVAAHWSVQDHEDALMVEFPPLLEKIWTAMEPILARASPLRDELQAQLASRVDKPSQKKTLFNLDFAGKIVSALRFREEYQRFASVKEAHAKTFEWIFTTQSSTSTTRATSSPSTTTFKDWLRSDEPCFWINGKAGSGKSTLMKFLCRHPAMSSLLQSWAGRRQLKICSFFFWYAGQPLQNSHEGVLRSILCHVLEACPTLATIIFPEVSHFILCDGNTDDLQFTLHELQHAISLLPKVMPPDLAVFLLIDGIDEYTGNHFEFSRLLVEIAKTSAFKVLASSRPIPTCYHVFSDFPSLRLQDLTVGDFKTYIDDELINDSLVAEMEQRAPGFAKEISTTLIDKSSGVFLWIVLVVRRLLTGLGNYDSKSQLMQMIDELPTDLSQLYDHMFGKMGKEHQRDGSLLLQLTARALDVQMHSLTASQLYAAYFHASDAETLLKASSGEPVKDQRLRIKFVDGKLRSCCCGLVEVQYSDGKQELALPKVDFFHRTIYEYLHDPNVRDRIVQAYQITQHAMDLILLVSCVQELKWRLLLLDHLEQPHDLMDIFVLCLQHSETLSLQEDDRYVEHLETADVCFMKYCQMPSTAAGPLMPYQHAIHTFRKHPKYHFPRRSPLSEPINESLRPKSDHLVKLGSIMSIATLGLPAYFKRKFLASGLRPAGASLLMLYLLVSFRAPNHDTADLRSRYSRNLKVLLGCGVNPSIPAEEISSVDAPVLVEHCAFSKPFPKNSLISPWEYWTTNHDEDPTQYPITFQLLAAYKHHESDSDNYERGLCELRIRLMEFSEAPMKPQTLEYVRQVRNVLGDKEGPDQSESNNTELSPRVVEITKPKTNPVPPAGDQTTANSRNAPRQFHVRNNETETTPRSRTLTSYLEDNSAISDFRPVQASPVSEPLEIDMGGRSRYDSPSSKFRSRFSNLIGKKRNK